MSIEFRMPALGADMEFATLVEWKVKPGDVVRRGDVIAVVETDKGAIDIEVFDGGRVERLVTAPDTRVPVGDVMALLAGEATAAPVEPAAPASPVGAAPAPAVTPATAPAPAPAVAPAGGPSGPHPPHVKSSPAARVRATALGIDVATLRGTGPSGVITLQDVERAAQPAPRAAAGRDGMREVIAAAMARSKREIPHYYLTMTVDYLAARRWLDAHNAGVPVAERLLPVIPLLRALALAAAGVEGFNGYYRDGRFEPSRAVHLGVVTAVRGGGLMAPAILDAHEMPPGRLMQALRDVVNRARGGHLRSAELSSGTITITSLGDDGVEAVLPVIYPPQVAIVGAGAIGERAQVVNGVIEARPTVTLALAADHRVSNGRSGAAFLGRIRDLLQTPEKL